MAIRTFDSLNFTKVKTAKEFTDDELVAKIVGWMGIANIDSWILDMRSAEVPAPTGITVKQAYDELHFRSKERAAKKTVKTFIETAVKKNVLSITPDEIVIRTGSETHPIANHGGFLLRPQIGEETKTEIAIQNVADVVAFPIDKEKKVGEKTEVSVVLADTAEKIQLPLFPTVSVFGSNTSRVQIENTVKDICKRKVVKGVQEPSELPKERMQAFVNMMTSEISTNPHCMVTKDGKSRKEVLSIIKFNKDTMQGGGDVEYMDKTYYWTGMMFVVPIPVYQAKVRLSCAVMYNIMQASRGYRGGETGIRADYTRGYYFGYVPSTLYRAYHVIADVLRIGLSISSTLLEIERIGGLFTSTVIESLIANGWTVRILMDWGLPEGKWKDGKPPVGAYRKVKFDRQYIKWVSVDDKIPVLKNGVVEKKKGVMESLHSYVQDGNLVEGRVICCNVYLRDEMVELADHLLPSAHAHSGQVVFVDKKVKESLDFERYIKRVIDANAHKNSYIYHKKPYIGRDPYAFAQPVNICQKHSDTVKDLYDFEGVIPYHYESIQYDKIDYVFPVETLQNVIIKSHDTELTKMLDASKESLVDQVKNMVMGFHANEAVKFEEEAESVPETVPSKFDEVEQVENKDLAEFF